MKMKKPLLVVSVAGILGVSLPAVYANAGAAAWQGGGSGQVAVSESLSYLETLDLSYMREEEKLARDVYATLHEKWRHAVFSNISSAEQKHMNSMGKLIDRYGLLDPVADDTVGSFTDPVLERLYGELIEKGETSLLAALRVGGEIEEIDILDLQRAIENATHQDLVNAYENLMRGSRNHLRAFVRQIESLGVAYGAQVMEQEEVNTILAQPMERGGRKGQGGRKR